MRLKAPVPTRSEKLRARALNCKLLAIAVCDAAFAEKLYSLADEYDDEAALIDANAKIGSDLSASTRRQSA
jgi:hypothetical protein